MKKIIARAVLAGLLATVGQYAAAETFNINGGNVINLPFSTSYGNSFTTPVGNFIDDFVFTFTPNASFNSFAATIDLSTFDQITGLKLALFTGSTGSNGGSNAGSGWTQAITGGGTNGEFAQLTLSNLTASTYTLEIRGDVTGSAGGSYTGLIQLAPVPEPETYALMLAGLGLLGWVGARRRKSA